MILVKTIACLVDVNVVQWPPVSRLEVVDVKVDQHVMKLVKYCDELSHESSGHVLCTACNVEHD